MFSQPSKYTIYLIVYNFLKIRHNNLKESLAQNNKLIKINVTDAFSKHTYSFPLKFKSLEALTEAFNLLFKIDNRKPRN